MNSPFRSLVLWARMVKLSHTAFALPFAFAGAALAAFRYGYEPRQLLWVALAMVGARNAAMGFNRLVDRKFDAANPRTKNRELPAGTLSSAAVATVTILLAALFVFSAFQLNKLCGTLSLPALVVILGYSYARSGQPEKALKILARLEELSLKRYVGPHNFAVIELALGRKDRALDLLEKAYRDHDACCFWFKVGQEFDAVRDEPRSRALLQKIGHTDAAAVRGNDGRP